jgi:alginate O-acetyltransferase complex protein AlgI
LAEARTGIAPWLSGVVEGSQAPGTHQSRPRKRSREGVALLFNSYQFIVGFLPLVLLTFLVLTRWHAHRATLTFLVLASLFFYGWWNWVYLFLVLFSILFNHLWGRLLSRRMPGLRAGGPHRPRGTLALGIAVNLGLLGYFKYANFFVDTVNATLGVGWRVPPIVLPLAISFFTFEQITYLVDAYHGELPKHDFLSYCLFVTFFPHLIAGPIVRPKDLLPQFTRTQTFAPSSENLATGLFIFAIGLFKKVVVADTFGGWVGPIFDLVPVVPFSDAWGAALAFTLQIYFDFSGYSDMAVGLALMLNIRLPENFESPYKATSIIDFWRRWHITLSTFLRDFVFFPFGGLHRSAIRRYVVLGLTMLLCGLWHGANWTFVVFGGLHGAYLIVNHLWRNLKIDLPKVLCWLITFVAVVASFVFFRAQTFARAGVILRGMAGVHGFAFNATAYSLGRQRFKRLVLGLLVVTLCPNRQQITQWAWRSDLLYAAAFALLAGLSILRLGNPSPFLYFQF